MTQGEACNTGKPKHKQKLNKSNSGKNQGKKNDTHLQEKAQQPENAPGEKHFPHDTYSVDCIENSVFSSLPVVDIILLKSD